MRSYLQPQARRSSMKQPNPKLLPLGSQIGIVLSTFLVSVGNAYAQSPLVDNREPTKTVIVAQAQQSELQQERRINAQVQAEANQIFSRTMTLFNLLLVTLALLLAAAIAALFLLRRAVIREVAEIVQLHLKEL